MSNDEIEGLLSGYVERKAREREEAEQKTHADQRWRSKCAGFLASEFLPALAVIADQLRQKQHESQVIAGPENAAQPSLTLEFSPVDPNTGTPGIMPSRIVFSCANAQRIEVRRELRNRIGTSQGSPVPEGDDFIALEGATKEWAKRKVAVFIDQVLKIN